MKVGPKTEVGFVWKSREKLRKAPDKLQGFSIGYHHGSDRVALGTRGGNSSRRVDFCDFQTDPASDDRRGELAKVSQVGKQAPDWLPADPHRSAESHHGT